MVGDPFSLVRGHVNHGRAADEEGPPLHVGWRRRRCRVGGHGGGGNGGGLEAMVAARGLHRRHIGEEEEDPG